jgi:ABC-type multidrug transport system ATPase subunit
MSPSGSPLLEVIRSTVAAGAREKDGRADTPMLLCGLTKRWRDDQPAVLDDVSLALDPGTATWVGGRNGVGKTTMLRVAAGLIDADRGYALAYGARVRDDRARYQRLVAFLPAGDRGLYARLTVRRHLDFWARLSMVPGNRARGRVEEAIAAFELSELAGRRVDRLSMGQRQRLRIAMTFLPRPQVVLLDEPLTSLDPEGAGLLEGAVEEVLGRGGAVLWCSPSPESLKLTFDTLLTLAHGRLEEA